MNKKIKGVPPEVQQLTELGRTFHLRRLDMKLNLQQVAEKSGVSSLTISKLEKGELTNSSLETLNKIAGVLKTKLVLNYQMQPIA